MASSKQGEVTVFCLGDTATIPDLGLHLGRGESRNISFSASQGSKDLRAARDQGLVSIRVMRAMAFRPGEDPQPVKPPRPGDNVTTVSRSAATAVTSTPSQPIPSSAPQSPEFTPLLGVLQQILMELQGLRADLAGRLVPLPVDHHSMATYRTSNAQAVGSQEEVYIPRTRLEEFTDMGRVSVETKESDHSVSVEDAVSALRARKKGLVE